MHLFIENNITKICVIQVKNFIIIDGLKERFHKCVLGSCDTPLLLQRGIEFTWKVSSEFGTQHTDDQLLYGDKPASGKAGYWKPSAIDMSTYIEVCALVNLRAYVPNGPLFIPWLMNVS